MPPSSPEHSIPFLYRSVLISTSTQARLSFYFFMSVGAQQSPLSLVRHPVRRLLFCTGKAALEKIETRRSGPRIYVPDLLVYLHIPNFRHHSGPQYLVRQQFTDNTLAAPVSVPFSFTYIYQSQMKSFVCTPYTYTHAALP